MAIVKENSKKISNPNDRLSAKLNEKHILASYLLSVLSKGTNPETTSQFKLVNDSNSDGVNDLLINETEPVTLH